MSNLAYYKLNDVKTMGFLVQNCSINSTRTYTQETLYKPCYLSRIKLNADPT